MLKGVEVSLEVIMVKFPVIFFILFTVSYWKEMKWHLKWNIWQIAATVQVKVIKEVEVSLDK